jgi:hypothetical protein
MKKILGIDVGGVIMGDDTDKESSIFSQNYLSAKANVGAFEAIKTLHGSYDEVHIVSKCGHNVQRKTREWLLHNKFPEVTGFDMGRLHFCLERKDKAPICKELSITTFIDDRAEILHSMIRQVESLYLFNPKPKELAKYVHAASEFRTVKNWADLMSLEGVSNK